MSYTVPAIEVSDEEEASINERIKPYRSFINENSELLSILYDADLLPEQIKLTVNVNRMIVVCELFRMTKSDQSPSP